MTDYLQPADANSASAFYRWVRSTLTMEVVAYQDIQPEEEITINCEHIP